MPKTKFGPADALKAFDRACGLLGNQIEVARHLGMTQQGISKIRRSLIKGNIRALKGEYAKALEDATGGAVTRRQLRRDIFG